MHFVRCYACVIKWITLEIDTLVNGIWFRDQSSDCYLGTSRWGSLATTNKRFIAYCSWKIHTSYGCYFMKPTRHNIYEHIFKKMFPYSNELNRWERLANYTWTYREIKGMYLLEHHLPVCRLIKVHIYKRWRPMFSKDVPTDGEVRGLVPNLLRTNIPTSPANQYLQAIQMSRKCSTH